MLIGVFSQTFKRIFIFMYLRLCYTVDYDFQIKSAYKATTFFNQPITISGFLWLNLLKCIRNYRKQNKWQFKCFIFNIHGFWFNDLLTRFSNLRFSINQSHINILSCMNICAFVQLFRVQEIVSRKNIAATIIFNKGLIFQRMKYKILWLQHNKLVCVL